MQNAWVNVNGEIHPPSQARVEVFDRGFLYGDSLYEVVRSYQGVFLHLREHLERLENSARLCRMVLGQSVETYEREMVRTLDRFRAQPSFASGDAYCRLIVTRGSGKIGFGLDCLTTPTRYVIIVQPLESPTPEKFERGARLQISARLRNDRRALDPAMKSGNYLNSLLAFLDASAAGFDDALLCDAEGFVTEGTTFNVFYVRSGIVATPPLDVGILDGITRRQVIAQACFLGLPVRETRFPKQRLYEADEVFVTSTLKEVFPVVEVDGNRIHGGRPGPITRKLAQAYRKALPALRRGADQPSRAERRAE